MRTTHVTGTVTDIGIEAANLFFGRQTSTWKLELMCSFYTGYLLGGIVGASLAIIWSPTCIIIPAALYIVLATLNFIHYHHNPMMQRPLGPLPTLESLKSKRVFLVGMSDSNVNGQSGIVSDTITSECCVTLDSGIKLHIPADIAPTRLVLVEDDKTNLQTSAPATELDLQAISDASENIDAALTEISAELKESSSGLESSI